MSKGCVVVIDTGTSYPRCVVFNHKGQIIGSSAGQWSNIKEEDASPFARAFDHQVLWRSLCDIIKGALQDASVSAGQISAVAATGQRQGVVFLDGNRHEIYAGPNLDLRAVFEGGAIDQQMADSVYRTTGHLPSFLFSAAKLRWFQLHRPQAYDRITCVLPLPDWVLWRLTGVLAGEPTLAGEAGLLDIGGRKWCTALFEELGLKSNSIPLAQAGTMAGEVGAGPSLETGLAQGTPVAVAGADTQCGLLGLGVAHPHQVGIVAGWSAPLQMVTSRPLLSSEARTWAGCFLEPDHWVLESSAGDLGNSYRWLVNTLYSGSDHAFAQMDEMATATPVGSEGTLAFLGPSRMNMAQVGMRPGGFVFPVPLTYSNIGRGHLVRAALEASCYTIRANLEQMEEVADTEASTVAVGGGMARTSTWLRILPDALGREVRVAANPRVSALGAYLCARRALGTFGSLKEAAASMESGLETMKPDPLTSAEYQDHYRRWLEMSEELRRLQL